MKKYCKIKTVYSNCAHKTVIPVVSPFEMEINDSGARTISSFEFLSDKRYEIYKERLETIFSNSREYYLKPENSKKKIWIQAHYFDVITEKELHNEAFRDKMEELLK